MDASFTSASTNHEMAGDMLLDVKNFLHGVASPFRFIDELCNGGNGLQCRLNVYTHILVWCLVHLKQAYLQELSAVPVGAVLEQLFQQ